MTQTLLNVLLMIHKARELTGLMKGDEKNSGPLKMAYFEVQNAVNRVYDREFSGMKKMTQSDNLIGLKQILEKKDGLFRMYMMGKRVDFAARSVITPDPLLAVEEIGVPFNFAQKLTYPSPVTEWNYDYLRQAVINGSDIYPGAEMIELENGHKVVLKGRSKEERIVLANELRMRTRSFKKWRQNKVVHRHMINGDHVLVNRQPSLHRASIMAHRVRVLPIRNILRLHYANCKAYNADFDGDEMNVHFPQSEEARSEAASLSE
jgi:DNA-directed RNA polymerase I subunit RPA1